MARPRAGDIRKVPLGVVDLVEFDLVGDGLDPRLFRQDVVVARHHHDRLEFEALGEMRGADGHPVAGLLDGDEDEPQQS